MECSRLAVVLLCVFVTMPGARVSAACDTAPWEFTDPLSVARIDAANVRLDDGRILVVAGPGAAGELASCEIFDPSTRTWSMAAPLNHARRYATATLLLDGKVLVIGGRGPGLSAVLPCEIYDPVANNWSVVASLSVDRIFHTATLLENGGVLVTGGTSANSAVTRSSCEIFVPASSTFVPAAPLPFTAGEHEAIRLQDGHVLVTGGRGDAGMGNRQLTAAATYDPDADAWTRRSDMNDERESHSVAVLSSGSVLVAGGATLGEFPLASAEIFDPSSGTFRLVGPMANARAHARMVSLECGQPMIIGGSLSSHFADAAINSCEAYDAVSETWQAMPPLQIARYSSVAHTLDDGVVLVAGGDARPLRIFEASVEILRLEDLNRPPVVNAGPDQARGCDDGLQLVATARDPDDDLLAVSWMSSCGATFSDATRLDPVVTFGSSCGVACELTVSVDDGRGGAASDSLEVTIDDSTPPAVLAAFAPAAASPPASARPPASPSAACLVRSDAALVVVCVASEDCGLVPSVSARLLVTNHDVPARRAACIERIDAIEVECGELVLVRLVAAACPERPPRSAVVAAGVTSAGVRVVTGESVVLEVTATNDCGASATATADPSVAPTPPCGAPSGTPPCCPLVTAPPAMRCPGGHCR